MKIPANRLNIEVSYDNPADAILAMNWVNTILMVGLPQDYQQWNNVYSYLPENEGQRKVIGRFKITTLGGE